MKSASSKESAPTMPLFAKANFLILGFGCYIGWSAVLAAVDYFELVYPGYNYTFYFSIPYMLATSLFSCILHIIAHWFRLNSRIIGGLIIVSFFIMVMPFIGYLFPNSNGGFSLLMVILFMIGLFSTIATGSAVAFSSIFPGMGVSYFFTGSGLAGVATCLLRILSLAIYGEEKDSQFQGCLIYFLFNLVLLYLSIAFYVIFIRSEYYHFIMIRLRRNTLACEKSEQLVEEIVMSPFDVKEYNQEIDALYNSLLQLPPDNVDNKKMLEELNQDRKVSVFNKQRKFDIRSVFVVFRKILPMPILCFIIYFQTFTVFPGVALKKEISFLTMSEASSVFVLLFGIFDMIGKYMGSYRDLYNMPSTFVLVISRFFFYINFIVAASAEESFMSHDWFAFLNISLFSFSNGYLTSCVMTLAPEKVDKEEKESSSFLMILPLYLGIIFGSLMALPFINI